MKVGFDLDGVLLYNPARIFRPITVGLKSLLKSSKESQKKPLTHFYYPKSSLEQLLWHIVHWSSMFISPGFEKIQQLSQQENIEAYIVTSRYDCLKNDFERWLKRMNAKKYFHQTYHNKDNLQPHVFKEKMINKLKLSYFIEDNWDIVQHINKTTSAKVLWISNSFDAHIPYDLKFLSLKDAMVYLEKKIVK